MLDLSTEDLQRLDKVRMLHDELAMTFRKLADRYGCGRSNTRRCFNEMWRRGRHAYDDHAASAMNARVQELGDEPTWE